MFQHGRLLILLLCKCFIIQIWRTENMVEKDLICDVCGKTFKDIINHKDKHVCKVCYEEIFSDQKSEK